MPPFEPQDQDPSAKVVPLATWGVFALGFAYLLWQNAGNVPVPVPSKAPEAAASGAPAAAGSGAPSAAMPVPHLTLGTLGALSGYERVTGYLKESLGAAYPADRAKIEVAVAGGESTKYEEARASIKGARWDVVFAYSPMISLACRQSGYRHVGRMFADRPSYYRSCLFVRKDSPLHSLADIRSATVIALGSPLSASSFYMPLYDLYGLTATLKPGFRGPAILDMVRTGVVAVGAAGEEALAGHPEFRSIHVSRLIPGSGVYVSGKLPAAEADAIARSLLAAPKDVKAAVHYEAGAEPDYAEFVKISERTEAILRCVDLTKSPVRLACK